MCIRDRFLDIIDIEAERLYQLIRDTLSLSEIEEAPQDAEERETFDLVEAVEEVEVLLDEEAQARGVVLRAPEAVSYTHLPGSCCLSSSWRSTSFSTS